MSKIAQISNPYNGGRFVNWQGYVQFRFRDASGKIVMPMEHRLVMEHHLGRKLWPQEVIHHKNGRTQDNRIENLEIKSRSRHMTDHHREGPEHPWKQMNRLTFR